MAVKIALVLVGLVGNYLVGALEPYETFAEGTCAGIPKKSVAFNRNIVNKFQFISGGNKYHLFQAVSQMPNYREINDDDFYYDSCLGSNSTSDDPEGHFFAFGRDIGYVNLRYEPGIYLYGYAPGTNMRGTPLFTEVITLTDNKTFAFVLACWNNVNVKSWAVLTAKPWLDQRTERMIENHARSLGFNMKHSIFLRYGQCQWGTGVPALDRIIRQGRPGQGGHRGHVSHVNHGHGGTSYVRYHK